MSMEAENQTPSQSQRMEIFRALVEIQDTGTLPVAQSREKIAEQFAITVRQVLEIEREGLDGNWPPLGE